MYAEAFFVQKLQLVLRLVCDGGFCCVSDSFFDFHGLAFDFLYEARLESCKLRFDFLKRLHELLHLIHDALVIR